MAVNGFLYEPKGGYFSVEVKNREVITAELSLPEFWLPLSNLDLLLPPLDASIYFIYKKTNTTSSSSDQLTFCSIVGILKKSLAQVLVHYYPLAGEMVANSLCEPELLCNNNGVEFIEAHADIELNEMKLHDPDETVRGKLALPKTCGVMCVQVTKLKCEGIVVACTLDHRVADAYSTNMFVSAWAEMARTGSVTLIPNFHRSLLSPRRPGSYNKSLENMYVPIASLSPPTKAIKAKASPDELISRIYHVSATDMAQLQALACTNGARRTKLEAFSAYLWKLIAYTSGDAERCQLGIVVDGRSRLSNEMGPTSKLYSYFGNMVSIPFGEASVEDLKGKPLEWAANEVHELLVCAANKEHFQGLIDYVEGQRPKLMMTRLYHGGENDGPAIVISHGRLFDVKSVDFGWGSPFLASCHFPWGGDARYVMLMPSPLANGDWVVYMHLFKHQLDIEKMQGGIFQPINVQHLTPI